MTTKSHTQLSAVSATVALTEWANAVADNHGYYDPRESEDLAEKLVRETPVATSVTLAPEQDK